MARAISPDEYQQEVAMIATIDAMGEELDWLSRDLYLRFRAEVAQYEVEHHLTESTVATGTHVHH